MRLSKYLKDKHPELGSRAIKRALERGACKVNGRIERYGSRLIEPKKDQIDFTFINIEGREKLSIKKERIIFEDKFILAYDKEARYPALATEGGNVNLHEELQKFTKLKSLQPVHRLDKDTSGVMLFGKSSDAVKRLTKLFQDKEIQKTYLALVDGCWDSHKKGCIDNELELAYKKGSMQKWRVADKKSPKTKQAITDYKVKDIYETYSLVEFKPKTGRTHQIRVHSLFMGYPLLGDTVYSKNFLTKEIFLRHLLHAHRLEFKHPFTQEAIKIEAPLPEDMTKLLSLT